MQPDSFPLLGYFNSKAIFINFSLFEFNSFFGKLQCFIRHHSQFIPFTTLFAIDILFPNECTFFARLFVTNMNVIVDYTPGEKKVNLKIIKCIINQKKCRIRFKNDKSSECDMKW